MRITHALLKEAVFDQSGITSRDWNSYPILKMADIPEIEMALLNRPEVGRYGGGSEAANALATPAIPAAFFDTPPGRWRAGSHGNEPTFNRFSRRESRHESLRDRHSKHDCIRSGGVQAL